MVKPAAIWLMNGTTPIAQSTVGDNPGPNWHVKDAGDFNGDGMADIVWQKHWPGCNLAMNGEVR